MKKALTKLNFLVALAATLTFTSCKQLEMSNEEAKSMVVQHLNLPQNFSQTIGGTDPLNNADDILEQEGYIYKSGSWLHGYSIHPTEKGQQFITASGKDGMYGTKTVDFKTFDINFGEITGIAVNKDQETATVRFTLVATNVTPIGKIVEPNIDQPKSGEMMFKKFDNGWQLASGQQSGANLLRQIVWGRNSR